MVFVCDFQVSQPYMWEDSFLQAATERYKCFLHLMYKSRGRIICIPTFDIDLVWHSHQLAPVAYAKDTKSLLGSVADYGTGTVDRGPGSKVGQVFEDTARLWESMFGLSYERAGSMYRNFKPVNVPPPPVFELKNSLVLEKPPTFLPWDARVADQNPTKYPVLTPRHVVQVCVLMKCVTNMVAIGKENSDLFIRLRTLDAYTLLKLDTPVVPLTQDPQWQKLWALQCETKTKGVTLELRSHVDGCMRTFHKTKRIGRARLTWQDLQKAPTLSHEIVFPLHEKRYKSIESRQPLQLRLDVSITPPVQAAYFLKSLPDRVTDDQGAMLSGTILRKRRWEPQAGRWISRTVVNHAGKENFVIRIRAAKGSWRKRGDRPVGVDWNERVINIHEGGWNYVVNSVGIAPEKIVGSATPLAHELEEYKLSWALSTGDTLIISRQMSDDNWERHLEFTLKTSGRGAGLARLVNGRKQQYEVPGASPQDEEGFITLIRYGPHTPQGKATALFSFKVSAMEVLPEEDVVLVLLLCTATMRSIADFGGLSAGNDYTRRRTKENNSGYKDWGSVILENTARHPNLAHWYWDCSQNAEEDEGDGENHPGRIAASDTKVVDWSGTELALKSTSSRRLATQSSTATAPAVEGCTPVKGHSGRRSGRSMSQITQNVNQSKRPTSVP
uniref:GRPD C-terminal domain-containing protein n=1 Tax=Physcomitrium patens TaxID=3218 RepID=A0A7I4FBT1_PHYPA